MLNQCNDFSILLKPPFLTTAQHQHDLPGWSNLVSLPDRSEENSMNEFTLQT